VSPKRYAPLPDAFYATLNSATDSVLLETARCSEDNFRSLLFHQPVAQLSSRCLDAVPALLAELEHFLERGYFIAGYLTYEAGFAFEPCLQSLRHELPYPLVWLGVYEPPLVFHHGRGELIGRAEHLVKAPIVEDFQVGNTQLATAEQDYTKNIERIRDYIRAGDVYQINFTTKLRFGFEGSALALYRWLKAKQRVPYSAIVKTADVTVLSFSPELFFRRTGSKLICKPMKGTMRRGLTTKEDDRLAQMLRHDEKNCAENLMITDLIRNDLGRVAKCASVSVPALFEVERYETLWQMTSTVQAELQEGKTYLELFKAIFPCGSITGAPKIRAMQIIEQLEEEPRGIYTGAIGFISPHQEAVFNVAIRTVVLQNGQGECGIGSGIVWESDAKQEFDECQLKARFFTAPAPQFELLETLRWSSKCGNYLFLNEHLARLADSAHYFDFECNQAEIEAQLIQLTQFFDPKKDYRVRLRLNSEGKIKCDYSELYEQEEVGVFKVALARERTSSQDKFYRHKTTYRPLYDALYQKAVKQGFIDVLFFNERGELTEGAISNVIVKKGERYLTPPLSSGVLDGIYRKYFLQTQPHAQEKVLFLDDVLTADAVWICNSVRALRQVQVQEHYLSLEADERIGVDKGSAS
jgi:para-aminobenzoate synthetase/4-amino-4-deoxychorismate lyase